MQTIHKEEMRISKRNHVPSGVAPKALSATDVPRDHVPYEGISRYTGPYKENMEMLLKFKYDLPASLVRAKIIGQVVSLREPLSKAANIASCGA